MDTNQPLIFLPLRHVASWPYCPREEHGGRAHSRRPRVPRRRVEGKQTSYGTPGHTPGPSSRYTATAVVSFSATAAPPSVTFRGVSALPPVTRDTRRDGRAGAGTAIVRRGHQPRYSDEKRSRRSLSRRHIHGDRTSGSCASVSSFRRSTCRKGYS